MTTTKPTHSSLYLNCYYSNWLKQGSVCSSFAYQPSPTPKLWLDWQFGIVSNGYRWIWSWPLNLEGAKVTLLWCCVDIDLGFCTSQNNGFLCFWKFCWTSDPGFCCTKSMPAFSNSLLIFAAIQCKQWVTLILHSMQAFWKRLSLLFRGGGGESFKWLLIHTHSHYDCLYELITHHLNLWINDCHSLELWIIDFSNNYRVLCRI